MKKSEGEKSYYVTAFNYRLGGGPTTASEGPSGARRGAIAQWFFVFLFACRRPLRRSKSDTFRETAGYYKSFSVDDGRQRDIASGFH